jgi:Na+/proline symporter
VILLLGYFYFVAAGEAYALVSIGLVSFAAVAQFAPALLGGLYWKGATRNGALAGLSLGFAVWLYTLLLPAFAKSGWFGMEVVANGPFDITLLRPTQLFGLTGLDQTTHAMIWSMVANIGAYVAVSVMGRQTARPRSAWTGSRTRASTACSGARRPRFRRCRPSSGASSARRAPPSSSPPMRRCAA